MKSIIQQAIHLGVPLVLGTNSENQEVITGIDWSKFVFPLMVGVMLASLTGSYILYGEQKQEEARMEATQRSIGILNQASSKLEHSVTTLSTVVSSIDRIRTRLDSVSGKLINIDKRLAVHEIEMQNLKKEKRREKLQP